MNHPIKQSLGLITIFGLLLFGCEPSSSKISQYIAEGNYEELYDYFQHAKDKSISVVGYGEPTLYENVTNALVFNPSDYSTKTIENLSKYDIDLGLSITKTAIDSSYIIPEGLHPIIYTAFENQRVVAIGKKEVEQLIKSDPNFRPIIIEKILEITNSRLNISKISILANLGSIRLPRELLVKIENIPGEIASIKSQQNLDYQLTSNLKSQKFHIEWELDNLGSNADNKIAKAFVENSYMFEGYMVAFIGELSTSEYYEVRDLYSNLFLLQTTETRFTSKGFFKLRVLKSDAKIPMTLRDGGFKRDIPLISEVRKSTVTDYYNYKEKALELSDELTLLERKISAQERKRKKSPEEYERLIQEKQEELQQYKQELKSWILNNITL